MAERRSRPGSDWARCPSTVRYRRAEASLASAPRARGVAAPLFGLTEPEARSDSHGLKTKAVLKDGEWVINGAKAFITNSGTPMVAVHDDRRSHGRGTIEISNIIVPNGTPGFTVGGSYRKIGWHSSDTHELDLRRLSRAGGEPPRRSRRRAPQFPAVARRGEGRDRSSRGGVSRRDVSNTSVAYAKERRTFGKRLAGSSSRGLQACGHGDPDRCRAASPCIERRG